VSDTPLSNVGSSDADATDESVQRAWDRYAMPDLSGDREPRRLPLAPPSHRTTNAPLDLNLYDSDPAFGSSTALSDAFARARSNDLAEDDAPPPSASRRFRD
jgi:hypothetical protein